MTSGRAPTTESRVGPIDCLQRLSGTQVRLVGFAHAGGGPSSLQPLGPYLAPSVELWRVTLPGRGARRREPFARQWQPLVGDLAAAIAATVPPPYALLGHSLGALIAFEVARRLTTIDAPPVHLLVSGRPAPQAAVSSIVAPGDRDQLGASLRLRGAAAPHLLDSHDARRYFLPILRADLELASAYRLRPGPVLRCPIMALTGASDPIAAPAQLAGWATHTSSDNEIRVLPGDHFSLIDHAPDSASAILSRLAT